MKPEERFEIEISELANEISAVCHGHGNGVVIGALCTMLSNILIHGLDERRCRITLDQLAAVIKDSVTRGRNREATKLH